MVLILLAATGISAALGEWTDAITIVVIVLLNAILGFVQEYRTEKTLESLRNMTAPTAKVWRDGALTELPAEELVPEVTVWPELAVGWMRKQGIAGTQE
jgi:Ca2+-transporting ATPase